MSKFVIKKAKTGFTFNFVAPGDDILAMSEVYVKKDSAKQGIASVKKNAGAEIEDQTVTPVEAKKNPKFEVYKDKSGKFRFRQRAANGQTVIQSTSGYPTHDDALNAVKKIKKTAEAAAVEEEGAEEKPAAKKATEKKPAEKKPAAKKTGKK